METANVLATPSQCLELGAATAKEVAEFLLKDVAQYWITHPGELGEVLKPVLGTKPTAKIAVPTFIPTLNRPLADLGKLDFWLEMWRYLKWEVDPSGLIVPKEREGFNWLIVSPKGITPNKAYGINAALYPCSCYTEDLDAVIKHEDRTAAKGPYIIRVRDRIEADEELKNLSANDLEKKKIPAVTLTERMNLEPAVYLATGQHLDLSSWSLCAGSRRRGGSVPRCCRDDSKFRVTWYSPVSADDDLRGRQVVSAS